ncbi:hypothetical protein MMC32_005894 [Xylographa parallela]|nr:hypothetical protein [Xylographa parallela]
MPDPELPSNELLASILTVLERIEHKFTRQDEQVQRLKAIVDGNISTSQEAARFDVPSNVAYSTEADVLPRIGLSNVPLVSKKNQKISYRDWNLDRLEGHLDDELSKFLQTYLGGWSEIPGDGRLPLSFSRYGTESSVENWDSVVVEYFHHLRPHYSLPRLNAAREFDNALRACRGNDFLVVDFDHQNHHLLYRLGDEVVGNDLLIPDTGEDSSAPWSRLILFQGMTTGDCINPDTAAKVKGFKAPIPYFDQSGGNPGLWSTINTHLQNKGRNVSVNPYNDKTLGFNTMFYEIIKDSRDYHELWRHGPLYDDPLERSFRKCSYTLYGLSSAHTSGDLGFDIHSTVGHWTILVLCPGNFFDQSNTSFPMTAISAEDKHISGHFIGRLTKLGAEMNLIGQGLQRISDRWTDFQTFFEYILDSGDSLMQPAQHDNLLFDDGAFSRSRRYFWAIDCLSEFEINITDNITQWTLWKKARIEVLLQGNALSELDLVQYRVAEQQCRVLENQRQYFKQKLASTIALRDALFNASAVIESRASTRLGENVKLLTFVSIFFLPLSFCTSLFSTTQPSNALLPTILSVGIATYIVVLNINTIVQSSHTLYNSQKRHLIRAMKADAAAPWRERGKRFEVFRPKHESVRPSEWYLPLYALLRIGSIGRVWTGTRGRRPPTRASGNAQTETTRAERNWWVFRGSRPKQPEREDEGWVI